MRISILSVGSELLDGGTPETNSVRIIESIGRAGYSVRRTMTVTDQMEDISDALRTLVASSDAVIVTGGLGPTEDDRTREAVSALFGMRLTENPAVLEDIREKFRRMNISMPDQNRKQALIPDGASMIPNPSGTAAGFSLTVRGANSECLLAALPGVPSELESMLPPVVELLAGRGLSRSRGTMVTVKTIGLPESFADECLKSTPDPRVSVGTMAKPGQVDIRLEVLESDPVAARDIAHRLITACPAISERVFSYSRDDTIEAVLTGCLKEKNRTLVLAESCTGGWASKRLTDVPGSSAVFLGSVVAYHNRLKETLLGVPADTLARNGAVSFEAAESMTRGLLRKFGADYCVSVTGVAGPEGGSPEKPVGTVYVGMSDGRDIHLLRFHFPGSRNTVREYAVMKVFEILWLDLRSGRVDWNGIRMLRERKYVPMS